MSTKVEHENQCATPTENQPTEKLKLNAARCSEGYWKKRLTQRTNSDYQVRIRVAGKQEWFNLHTTNKEAAMKKAAKIYLHLWEHGAKSTLETYKQQNQKEPGTKTATVGEYICQLQAHSTIKPLALSIYSKKFRRLVAAIFGLEGNASKFDYRKGGRDAWRAKVDAVPLARLTRETVNDWQDAELKTVDNDPAAHRRKRITIRSLLLSGKALFSTRPKKALNADVRKKLTIPLPSPLPFSDINLPELERSEFQYSSPGNFAAIAQAARRELGEGENTIAATLTKRKNSACWWLTTKTGKVRSTGLKWANAAETKRAQKLLEEENAKPAPHNPRPELYKIFLLAYAAGLRRNEIDKLQWSQMLWGSNQIDIRPTEFMKPKAASRGNVRVDPEIMAILKSMMPAPGTGSPFVVKSEVAPRTNGNSYHYRCGLHFDHLLKWLKGKGVNANKALHCCRQECGSQIAAKDGIYAAKVIMRHSSVQTTEMYYADSDMVGVFHGVGKELKTPEIKAA